MKIILLKKTAMKQVSVEFVYCYTIECPKKTKDGNNFQFFKKIVTYYYLHDIGASEEFNAILN